MEIGELRPTLSVQTLLNAVTVPYRMFLGAAEYASTAAITPSDVTVTSASLDTFGIPASR